ncbi:small subunit of acetolactate synthase-domain-containing protein [Mrakia frigida]|uniref:acetolactate synthase regulatory subunit n=1 Tax=Mrakia frigida TaxID=29902 RepID=UPI003FCC13E6
MTSIFRSSLARPVAGRNLVRLIANIPEGGKPNSAIGAGHPDTSGEINQEKQAKSAQGKPRSIDDSTSALDYKLQRHHSRPPPLPVFHQPPKSAEDHVLSILYNTPPPSNEPFKRHILNCLVQNEPGVLSRVSGILAARGFNIDSLVVCSTEVRDLSRMCIVLKGQDGVVEQARRQLEDLVPVWAVLDYTQTSTVQREMLLVKLSTLGPEYFEDQMSAGPSLNPTSAAIPAPSSPSNSLARNFEHPSSFPVPTTSTIGSQGLNHSEALIRNSAHLGAIQALATQFGGKTVDISSGSVIVEMTGKTERVDAFLGLVRPYGILEAVRSGVMVMPRTPIPTDPNDEEVVSPEGYAVDASLLPPG